MTIEDIKNGLSDMIFYVIDFKGKKYLGELSPKTFNGDYMRYHLNNTNLPFYQTDRVFKDAWEKDLSDVIRKNGFKDTIKNDFGDCYSFKAPPVIDLLNTSMKNFFHNHYPALDGIEPIVALYEILIKQSTNIRPIENILINLLFKSNPNGILNTHANYGTKKLIAGQWNITSAQLKEIRRQALSKKVQIYISVDSQIASQVLNPAHYQKLIEKLGNRANLPILLNNENAKTITKFIERKISLRSLTSLYKELVNYWDNVPDKIKPQFEDDFYSLAYSLEKRLDALECKWKEIKKVKKAKRKGVITKADIKDTKNYTTWLNEVTKFTDKVNTKVYSTEVMPIDIIELFMKAINDWFTVANFKDFIPGEVILYDKEIIKRQYKKDLSAYFQKSIFMPIQSTGDIEGFHKWQIEKLEKKKQADFGGHSYQWFYIKYASIELDQDLSSLSEQSLSRLQGNGLTFYEKNWSKMYREQVSLWLNNEENHNDITTYQHFSSRFLQLQTAEEITIY